MELDDQESTPLQSFGTEVKNFHHRDDNVVQHCILQLYYWLQISRFVKRIHDLINTA